ncbi:anti-phage deoxyguanosine triphosphatase [Celerinatantimonas yamalensis]|uniref:Deoxyguanosinetriphosphate triphosphohydrolase-like protein n=1 Tax=Celerinatantimonas yamalensis TaxID=559956 RepID=A0ABW9G3L0_9GAMM
MRNDHFVVPNWQARPNQHLPEREHDPRSPWQRDRGRIVHSAAFRRLQSKTQVLGIGHNDFYRTRLTHSLEVAQIGTGIVSQLRGSVQASIPLPDPMLVEALCLAHDIGHPPFGHGGEVALNYLMREHGGFEGNAQTFRILTKLEPYTPFDGMNLTRRTLLGVSKYPVLINRIMRTENPPSISNFRQLKAADWLPAKGIYDDDQGLYTWMLAPLNEHDHQYIQSVTGDGLTLHQRSCYKSLDCSIMELADDIAYGVHDLEDAIVMGLLQRDIWQQQVVEKIKRLPKCWLNEHIDETTSQLFSPHHYAQKNAIGALVNAFITAIHVSHNSEVSEPLIAYQACMDEPYHMALNYLKQFVLNYVIQTPDIEQVRYRGQQIVMELFEAFSSDPMRLLPLNTQERWQKADENDNNPYRIIADYIAGMTDEYALRLNQRLFG